MTVLDFLPREALPNKADTCSLSTGDRDAPKLNHLFSQVLDSSEVKLLGEGFVSTSRRKMFVVPLLPCSEAYLGFKVGK